MFGTLELTRTNPAHIGNSPLQSLGSIAQKAKEQSHTEVSIKSDSFESYLMEAVSNLNKQQNSVTNIQKQLITDPDSVDIHDVTIAMSKAQMSLSLAQSVVDRIIKGWSEVTTTR